MLKQLTCILCPNGCRLEAEQMEDGVVTVRGATCDKGRAYAIQELTAPRRTISSSVRLIGGELPLTSVRLNAPVPKERIMDVMAEIRRLSLTAPVSIGQCAIRNVLGLNADVIVTKHVAAVAHPDAGKR